jgi:hypothetical protein
MRRRLLYLYIALGVALAILITGIILIITQP